MYKKLILLVISLGVVTCELNAEDVVLELRVEPRYFSPNADNYQDQVFFYPVLRSGGDVRRWRLDLTREGRRIMRTSGNGLAALIPWDGTGRKGAVALNGVYEATLTVWGDGFRTASPPQAVYIDTNRPQTKLHLSTTVLDKTTVTEASLTFRPEVMDVSPITQWSVQIINERGRTVYIHASSGPLTEVVWDGKDHRTQNVVPQGNYQVAFSAWDSAGNESMPLFRDFSVRMSPELVLMSALKTIQVKKLKEGFLIQLKSNDLFRLNRGKPKLRFSADQHLQEVALMANAYPEQNVFLEGYSRKNATAKRDKDLSSLYAWAVYSHLVKKGNVLASRLSVQGRGRTMPATRRALNVPLLFDGVEVIIKP